MAYVTMYGVAEKTYMTEEPVNGKARISPDVEGSMGIFVPEGQFRQEVRVEEGHNAFLNGVMERHVADGGKLYTMGVPENGEIFITVEPTFSDNAAPICSVRLSDIEYVNVEMAEQDFAAAVAAIPVNDNQMEQ